MLNGLSPYNPPIHLGLGTHIRGPLPLRMSLRLLLIPNRRPSVHKSNVLATTAWSHMSKLLMFLTWRQAHIAWDLSPTLGVTQSPVARVASVFPNWLTAVPQGCWCNATCKWRLQVVPVMWLGSVTEKTTCYRHSHVTWIIFIFRFPISAVVR